MKLMPRSNPPSVSVRKKRRMPTESEVEELETQSWKVHDRGSAAWAMERLAALVERQKENDQVAAERVAVVTKWRVDENAKLQRSVDFFSSQLGRWHAEQFEANPKLNKSVSLPDGVLKHRAGSTVTTVDDAEFMEWAEAHIDESRDLVKVTVAPVKTAIRNYVEATGEVLPGVELVKTPDKFVIEPAVPGAKIEWQPFVREEEDHG